MILTTVDLVIAAFDEPPANAQQICSACEGTGSFDLFADIPCELCDGTGTIR